MNLIHRSLVLRWVPLADDGVDVARLMLRRGGDLVQWTLHIAVTEWDAAVTELGPNRITVNLWSDSKRLSSALLTILLVMANGLFHHSE